MFGLFEAIVIAWWVQYNTR